MDSKQAIIKDCNEAITKLEKAIANLAHEAAESFYLFYIEEDED